MEYTTNLNLKKPDVNEYYNIEQENENKDLIDSAIGELNSQVGAETLTTTAQDCTGAINELNKKTEYVAYVESDFFTRSQDYFAMSAKRIGNIVFARVLISGSYGTIDSLIQGGVLNKLKPILPVNVRLAHAGTTASYTGNLIVNTNGKVAFSSNTVGKELVATFVYFTEDY